MNKLEKYLEQKRDEYLEGVEKKVTLYRNNLLARTPSEKEISAQDLASCAGVSRQLIYNHIYAGCININSSKRIKLKDAIKFMNHVNNVEKYKVNAM